MHELRVSSVRERDRAALCVRSSPLGLQQHLRLFVSGDVVSELRDSEAGQWFRKTTLTKMNFMYWRAKIELGAPFESEK